MISAYSQLECYWPDQTPWGFAEAIWEGLCLLEEFLASLFINLARCGLVGFGVLATFFPSNYSYDPLEE